MISVNSIILSIAAMVAATSAQAPRPAPGASSLFAQVAAVDVLVQDTAPAADGVAPAAAPAPGDTLVDASEEFQAARPWWQHLGFFVLIAAVATAGMILAYRKVAHVQQADAPLPPLIFPSRPAGTMRPIEPPFQPAPQAFAQNGNAGASGNQPAAESEEVSAGPIRFHRPPDGTLQLLPGRLEILSGNKTLEEIRFVKLSGREPQVTFGRSTGEPHSHIQLDAATVSRMHARMHFHNGSWHITNLSSTNPVVLNGEELPVQSDSQVGLRDGDRLEMGEVIFRFRSK